MSKGRSHVGASLALIIPCIVVLVLIAVGVFYYVMILGGGKEFANASDAGALNTAKTALTAPYVSLSDPTQVTDPNAAAFFTGLGDGPNKDQINLNNINRVWSAALLTGLNYNALVAEGSISGSGQQAALLKAQKMCTAATNVALALRQSLTDSGQLKSAFTDFCNANSTRMLGQSASNDAKPNGVWQVAYCDSGSASNVYLANSQLPEGNLPKSVVDTTTNPPTIGGVQLISYNGKNYVPGYKTIDLGNGLKYYFTALPPGSKPHLVSPNIFNSSNNVPEGGSVNDQSHPYVPNTFMVQAEMTVQPQGDKGKVQPGRTNVISYSEAGPMNDGAPVAVLNGFVRINNATGVMTGQGPVIAGRIGNQLASTDAFAPLGNAPSGANLPVPLPPQGLHCLEYLNQQMLEARTNYKGPTPGGDALVALMDEQMCLPVDQSSNPIMCSDAQTYVYGFYGDMKPVYDTYCNPNNHSASYKNIDYPGLASSSSSSNSTSSGSGSASSSSSGSSSGSSPTAPMLEPDYTSHGTGLGTTVTGNLWHCLQTPLPTTINPLGNPASGLPCPLNPDPPAIAFTNADFGNPSPNSLAYKFYSTTLFPGQSPHPDVICYGSNNHPHLWSQQDHVNNSMILLNDPQVVGVNTNKDSGITDAVPFTGGLANLGDPATKDNIGLYMSAASTIFSGAADIPANRGPLTTNPVSLASSPPSLLTLLYPDDASSPWSFLANDPSYGNLFNKEIGLLQNGIRKRIVTRIRQLGAVNFGDSDLRALVAGAGAGSLPLGATAFIYVNNDDPYNPKPVLLVSKRQDLSDIKKSLPSYLPPPRLLQQVDGLPIGEPGFNPFTARTVDPFDASGNTVAYIGPRHPMKENLYNQPGDWGLTQPFENGDNDTAVDPRYWRIYLWASGSGANGTLGDISLGEFFSQPDLQGYQEGKQGTGANNATVVQNTGVDPYSPWPCDLISGGQLPGGPGAPTIPAGSIGTRPIDCPCECYPYGGKHAALPVAPKIQIAQGKSKNKRSRHAGIYAQPHQSGGGTPGTPNTNYCHPNCSHEGAC